MKKKKQINKIMLGFNFVYIADIMRYMDWMWYNNESEQYYYPDILKLVNTAKKLLKESYKQWKIDGQEKENGITWIASTGGFRAECTDGILRLAFELYEIDMGL